MSRSRTLRLAGAGCVVAAVVVASGGVTPGQAAPGPRDGRIVFSNADTLQIETINPDGTARRAVTPPDQVSYDPRWSPDASRIVYDSDPNGGNDTRLFTIKADGTGRHQVRGDQPGYQVYHPVYTPDGKSIVYTRCRPDPPGGCALFRVRVDGTGNRAITTYGEQADQFADVSPDGKHLAFNRFFYRGVQSRVWISRLDGSHAHPITSPALEAGTPRWTPDGKHLLVATQINHLGDNVVRIGADGSNPTRLTSRRYPHNAQWAAPSPSGKRIVYSDDGAYQGYGGFDLLVMRRNGSGKHPITSDGRLVYLDWGTAPLISESGSRSRVAQAPARKATAPRPGPWQSRMHAAPGSARNR